MQNNIWGKLHSKKREIISIKHVFQWGKKFNSDEYWFQYEFLGHRESQFPYIYLGKS